ncbi:MAG: two-component system sensor histidine kinase/response regulator, partial [Myxococcales bacterium]|nr:two-component system sensor histidine kinase/response regulator [Myxococcales bacterium]
MLPYPSSDHGDVQLRSLFPGESEMARRMRAFDWSASELGPTELWPQNLRAAVRLCLSSRFPIMLWWGPRLTLLYNDAYIPWLSEAKHPRALGRPGHECWREVWDTIGPMVDGVVSTSRATWSVDVELFYERKVRKEEVFVTWSFAPILAADGRKVDGVFCPCFETTEKVIGARRLETLRKLGIRPTEARSVRAACHEAAAVLGENTRDIPFAAVYVLDPQGNEAWLCALAVPSGEHRLPERVSLSDDDSTSPWPLATALRMGWSVDCTSLPARGVAVPGGPWSEPVENGLIIPMHG